jgi:flagellar biosynthesis GTPase FlhF
MYSTAVSMGLPVDYVCGGQQIPEDIEVATPERITELLLPAQRTGCERSVA